MHYAKYIGTAGVRRMLERDWKAAGVENQATVEWSPRNGFSVPQSDLTEAAWHILANDPGIVLTGDRPETADLNAAKVEAAKNRLSSRAAGADVLHAQDEIPGSIAPVG